jgi:hypothetical protein
MRERDLRRLSSYRNGAQEHESARASYETEEDEFADIGASGHKSRRDDIGYQRLRYFSAVLLELQTTYDSNAPFSTPSVTNPG